MINLFNVRMSDKAGKEVTKVLQSGFIGQGPKVEEFEDLLWKELKSLVRPVTVNSCTSAIDLALELIGVNVGDEVISIPTTCYASQIGAIHRGVKIRWADVHPYTTLIDVDSVRKLITPKTKAIIAVNWAGRICDYKKLKEFGIPVIEDAAHTWDVFEHNIPWENRGDYVCYSFQAIKTLNSSDGGVLIPPKEKESDARLLRWFGLDRTLGQSFRCSQNIKMTGFKYHMTDLNATIGICNIPEARDSVNKQRSNSKYLINNISNINIVVSDWSESCSYWLFSIHVLYDLKDRFIQYLKDNDIESSPVHHRNDEYDATLQFKEKVLPGVNVFAKTQVCIPNGWWLSQEDLVHIVNVVNSFKG